MKKVAVTGGLASGKSSVCRILESHGAYVVSADEIVHQLLSSNTAIGLQVVNKLGSDIITNNHLDRKKIAKIVFSDPEKLRALEEILHPKVFEEIEKQYQMMKNSSYTLFAAEVPLLYESDGEKYFDAVIAVLSDASLCKMRFQKEGNVKPEEFLLRMSHQLPPVEKAAKADFIIINNGSLVELKSHVESLIPKLV